MKTIIELMEGKPVEKGAANEALKRKVKETCMHYALEIYEIDKSKSITEWYEFFLKAMRDSYRKAKINQQAKT